MTKPLSIAVIGVGHLGAIHTKLLAQRTKEKDSHFILCGVYDMSLERAQTIAQEYDTQNFVTIADALSHADAVIIASTTASHYAVAKESIAHGKHCFIEKPICATLEQAEEIARLAQDHGVVIQVGHVERFNPAILALAHEEFAPRFIEGHRLHQFKPRATDVSVIHDLMIHDLDLVLWLAKADVISCDANGVAILTDTPDIANARITFSNGCVANLTASRLSANPLRKMRVFSNNAYYSIDLGNPDIEIFRLTNAGETIPEHLQMLQPALMLGNIEAGTQQRSIHYQKITPPAVNAIMREHEDFAKACMGISPAPVDAISACKALALAETNQNKILASLG